MLRKSGSPVLQRRTCLLACTASVVLGTTCTAFADSTDELLDLLRRRGSLTKSEYAAIKSRHAAEKKQSRSTGPTGTFVKGDAGPPPRYVTALDKGIGIRVGEFNVALSGSLSAFYVQQAGSTKGRSASIGGGLTDGAKNSSAVRGGLLPADVVLDVSTRQDRYDISGTLGIYTGINNVNTGALGINATGPGFAKSLGTPAISIHLAYLKVGTNGFGTFEAGRDFGLFGQDVLINDANILAVGVPFTNLSPTQFTLGNIGYGYLYSDFVPQFRYTTEDYRGFTATFTVETPYDASTFGGISGTSGGGTIAGVGGLLNSSSGGVAHNQPKFAGRLKYVGNLAANAKLTAWLTGTTQDLQGIRAAFPAGTLLSGGHSSVRAYGGEAGAKLDVGAAEFLGYGYFGKGIGTTALFLDGVDEQGNPRNSYGFLAQAGYTFFDRVTLTGGAGASYLEHTAFDTRPARFVFTHNNVKVNEAALGTIRYKLTNSVNLVASYIRARSKALDRTRIDSDAVAAGAQMFF